MTVTSLKTPGAAGGISGYVVNDMDTASDPQYFGYENDAGEWYILEMTTSTQLRYAKGASNYATAWTNRASQSYDLYGTTF